MKWPWSKPAQTPSPRALSFDDPALVRLLSIGGTVDLGGSVVSEHTALTLSAYWRAVSLIAGTLASMPLKSYRATSADPWSTEREPVRSIFDDPDPGGQTPYEWKESVFTSLISWGRAGALKHRTAAGGVGRLELFHPTRWGIRLPSAEEYASGVLPAGGLWFDVTLADGSVKAYDAQDFFYVPGLSLDGKTPVSLLTYARLSLGTTKAGDDAAGSMFATGAMISGIAMPKDEDAVNDVTTDLREIRRTLDNATAGTANAGKIALLNRRLEVIPFSMKATDAQFLQSRQFQIEEISRWTGVPPHLLMQTDKQTSWGTGVEEQNRALGRTVLAPWANRLEQRASRLLANPRSVAFDFTALERPSPDKETDQDLAQVAAGVMTINEYRTKRGWKPLAEQSPSASDQSPSARDQSPIARYIPPRNDSDLDDRAREPHANETASDRPIAIGWGIS